LAAQRSVPRQLAAAPLAGSKVTALSVAPPAEQMTAAPVLRPPAVRRLEEPAALRQLAAARLAASTATALSVAPAAEQVTVAPLLRPPAVRRLGEPAALAHCERMVERLTVPPVALLSHRQLALHRWVAPVLAERER